jgi:hypothetical protein
VEDNITLNIYLGLIYQKADNVRFEHETFQAFLKSMAEQAASAKLTSVKDYLSGFIEKAEVVTRSIQNISGRDRDKLSFTDYYEFYNSALDLVGYAATAYRFPGISEQNDRVDVGDNFARYLQYARTGSNIAMDISRRNYSSAIINTYTLYEKAFGGSDGGVRDTTDRFKGFMLKYGSFMAAVSQAQSSDDVESAIEAVALPAGSARIKRESCFNIALNAYAGLFYGREMIGNVDDHFSVYGVAAPIGFSLSKGHSFFFVGTGDCGWSTSLFVSLIDIGAVASFRFIGKNDSVAQAPTIQLKDIISPGLFLSVGFPKVPLSLNVGSQLGPNLRTVTSTTNTYEDKLYLRWSLSLCVDIPVINFFTTPRD